jgi:hypothetical protein
MTRRFPCARPGCPELAVRDGGFCSKRCTAIVTRAKQTPERRREIASAAAKSQGCDLMARLIARVKCFADTEDQRIVLAWRMGRASSSKRRYRQRQQHAASSGASTT